MPSSVTIDNKKKRIATENLENKFSILIVTSFREKKLLW